MEKFKPLVAIRYTKYIRVDPETWAVLKNEATKRTLETHTPCNVGFIIRELVKKHLLKR